MYGLERGVLALEKGVLLKGRGWVSDGGSQEGVFTLDSGFGGVFARWHLPSTVLFAVYTSAALAA